MPVGDSGADLVEGAVVLGELADEGSERGGASLAQRHAECAVCFEDLCSMPCAVFVDGHARRCCSHFLHEVCARALPTKACPLCRAPFEATRTLPSIRDDPHGWFACVDVEGDGRLSKVQVREALVTQFPLDTSKFDGVIDTLWARWDHDGSGFVSREEFADPDSGLLADVRAQLLKVPRAPPERVPDIATDRNKWFDHFDEGRSGYLSQEAVVRGLIKTYGLGTDLSQVVAMRKLVGAVWVVFDIDGTGAVSREEFLKPTDGLADAIIASRATLNSQQCI